MRLDLIVKASSRLWRLCEANTLRQLSEIRVPDVGKVWQDAVRVGNLDLDVAGADVEVSGQNHGCPSDFLDPGHPSKQNPLSEAFKWILLGSGYEVAL